MNGTCTYVDVSQQIGSNNKVSATFTVEPSESTTRAVVSATRAVVSAIAFVRTAINSRATAWVTKQDAFIASASIV